MNIRTQNQLIAWTSLLLALAVGVAMLVASERTQRAVERSHLATEIAIGMSELRFFTVEYVQFGHERPLLQWKARHEALEALLDANAYPDMAWRAAVETLRRRHRELGEAFSRLVPGQPEAGARPLASAVEGQILSAVMVTSQDMLTLSFRLLRQSDSEIARRISQVSMLVMLAAALLFVLLLASALLTERSVLGPIRQLRRGVEIVGRGELTHRVAIDSRNEVGALSREFDRMTGRLQELQYLLAAERAESARREARIESEARYRRIIDSVSLGVVSVDESLRIVTFNPGAEHLFGRSARDMLGKPLDALMPERFRAAHARHVERFADTGETTRTMGSYGIVYGLRADGSEFPVEATIASSGAAPERQFTVILRDITERMRSEQAQRDYAQQLSRLSRRLFEAEETERRHLARELHDRIGQNLTALSLNLTLAHSELPAEVETKLSGRFKDCESLVYYTAQLVRDIQIDLRPPGLDELGLVAALSEHARTVSGRSQLAITVTGAELAPRLGPASEITLFRIAQEALNNVVKHARASEVQIALEARPDALILSVADNGCGFDAAAPPAQPSRSLGMVGMRERAQSLGGTLRVEAAPGKGTRVIVEAPRAHRGST